MMFATNAAPAFSAYAPFLPSPSHAYCSKRPPPTNNAYSSVSIISKSTPPPAAPLPLQAAICKFTDEADGRMQLESSLVFGFQFCIRSYEVGADRTASIQTLLNHLQETAINHVQSTGYSGDSFGATPEMTKRNLIWVITKMQVSVDRYPAWGDVVQVDTWSYSSGKNSMHRNWFVRDLKTGDIITRASSVWVLMNRLTRKLSKIPEEVLEEAKPYMMNTAPAVDDNRKLPKLDGSSADYVLSGLTPRWSDLDVNQHVNNVKYIAWILESVPQTIPETHKLSAITVEYRRECGKNSVLKSLTNISGDGTRCGKGIIECHHLLQLETAPEILRARTEWISKEVGFRGAAIQAKSTATNNDLGSAQGGF